ncbi:FAD-dependent oxidoreductase [candidate division WS5 bacterium]|uniref:FAD-dependent oxidoreductase n=1 Tax=candidate division WS5 bacterium TaxID=2093353 RepID=A0A419DE55_9BACT|nr:MAG: FAD-dependent oxidoreductase [candidate division WS5 bacterium]
MEKENISEKDGFPGKPTSVWLDTTPETDYPSLTESDSGQAGMTNGVDVCVVGGGIAGLMTAYLLTGTGYKVTVIEAGRIVEDVTAYTTAKITSQHGYIYRHLIRNFGETKAKMYADANQAGLKKIVSIILNNNIDCNLEKQPAYLYTEKYRNIDKLKKEARSAQRLGLPATYTEDTPFDFIKGAVRFDSQAQFHPRKFLLFLAREIAKKGYIFENTRALDIKDGSVITDKGEVKARHIVVATHFPFIDKSRFFTKLFPHRSYILAVEAGNIPEGMYFGIDGDRNTMRRFENGGKKYLLVGAGGEKAGEDADTLKYYERVKYYTEARFKTRSIDYHWFTQDNRTADRVPYIGKMPKMENVYVATGFGGWGMTSSAVSAMIITDMISGRVNPWVSVFDPARKDYLYQAKTIIGESSKLASHLLSRHLKKHHFDLPTGFEAGEGKIIKVKGKKVAVYKDKDSRIYAVSPICTHMGCTVNWNGMEKTWDCPCHGSRYNYDGKVIHGPAQKDLKKEDI